MLFRSPPCPKSPTACAPSPTSTPEICTAPTASRPRRPAKLNSSGWNYAPPCGGSGCSNACPCCSNDFSTALRQQGVNRRPVRRDRILALRLMGVIHCEPEGRGNPQGACRVPSHERWRLLRRCAPRNDSMPSPRLPVARPTAKKEVIYGRFPSTGRQHR